MSYKNKSLATFTIMHTTSNQSTEAMAIIFLKHIRFLKFPTNFRYYTSWMSEHHNRKDIVRMLVNVA